MIEGNVIGGGAFIRHELGIFAWPHFVAVQLWIFVLFLIYVTANELNELLGDGELHKIVFKRRSSSLKATRRARIRMLTRLVRLPETHSPNELADRESRAHVELVGLLYGLSQRREPDDCLRRVLAIAV